MSKGVKNSSFKLPMSKLFVQFPDALKAVMLVSTYGHFKYKKFDGDWLNFKRVGGEDTYKNAMVRHLLKQTAEQEETFLPPEFHVAWNALADLQLLIESKSLDIDQIAENKILEWTDEEETL